MTTGPADSAAGGREGDGPDSDIPSSAAYRIELPEFEGPLDLLLHLCKTHEINVVDLPIAFITEKYLEYLERMQAMSVEVAAEYLVMAATLAYLKARELVPNPEPLEVAGEEDEGEGDPREELIRRLLEYQKYKDAAEQIAARPIEGRNVFGRGIKIDAVTGPGELAEHSVWKLIESFADLLKKSGKQSSHDVVVDRVSLSERINQIVDRLQAGGGSFRFDSLVDFNLSEIEVKHQLVVTLLAILELAKLRIIRVLLDTQSEQFYISQREGASLDVARRAQATSDIEALVQEGMNEAAQGQGQGQGDDPAGVFGATGEETAIDATQELSAFGDDAGADEVDDEAADAASSGPASGNPDGAA